jgi:O-phospho-L-seryl-tRNASec:L-selenocysteinyl-tRNA synthase
MIGLEDLASSLVNGAYVQQGVQSLKSHQSLLKTLLSERRMPEIGWSDGTIQMALHELSSMDSNNFHANAGVGEREGRVYSSLVSQRHTHLSHGIGRSGDLDEVQPKVAQLQYHSPRRPTP